MKLISWNVNGLKSALKKEVLLQMVESGKYDLLMLQETKTRNIPDAFDYSGYDSLLFRSDKIAFSGTAVVYRNRPLSVKKGFGDEKFDREGRVITMEFDGFYVINAYFPNSRRDLSRLSYKLEFDRRILEYADGLRRSKPVIIGGDFNVAHKEIDIARPEENRQHAGFTAEERAWMDELASMGYVDTYREFVKEDGHYSWWSLMTQARRRNVGWRIDYFIVSPELKGRLVDATILEDVMGSDHAPVYLEIRD